tara:strand:+ start:2444 stop:3706 length:1263 start_codon:yes stop_codon:yes gene_type:complete
VNTRIKIPNCDTLEIFKKVRNGKELKYWICRFYVGLHYSKSGNYEQSTKTSSKQEAIKIAKEHWHKFHRQNPLDKDVPKEMSFHHLATQYFDFETMKVENTKSRQLKNEVYYKQTLGEKDLQKSKSMYEKHIKEFFGGKNINLINGNDIEMFHFKLHSIDYAQSTIGSYLTLLKSIMTFAHKQAIIVSLPKFPRVERTQDDSFIPYTDEERHAITKELRKLSKTKPSSRSSLKSYQHYEEVADIVNFIYHSGFRPGKEMYVLKHKHFSLIVNTRNESFYLINPPHRKVNAKIGAVPTNHIVKDIYENRICKRYPNETGEEYIFFANNLDRQQIRNSVDKVFRKVSKSLNLYYVNDSRRNRSLYALRASGMIGMDINTNASLEDITRQHNSSPSMATKRYMKRIGQEKAIQLHERIYSKQK